ncbi:MAG: response regulator [Candidatus Dormibacteraeota bacterium]|nr:response regulator [Candidatus Dormibacteraeota bacterium]
MESATGSSPRTELAATLHRLRSTLARLKAELELSEVDGTAPPIDRLLGDLEEAFALLGVVEDASQLMVRVLVVDDDVRLADITARGLRRMGYDANASNSVRPLGPREVLVLDLGLLRGLDVESTKSVRTARPIVVTGATDAESRALAANLQASDYLVKPIELEELVAAIRRRMEEV